MLKKTITYTDYDGNKRTETFWFNLNKAEVAEMELSEKGGMKKMIEHIVETEDGAKIIATFKEMILKSIGEKSPDGKRFIKSDKFREEFEQTEAYVELFMELSTNAEAGAAFVNGIMPADLVKN